MAKDKANSFFTTPRLSMANGRAQWTHYGEFHDLRRLCMANGKALGAQFCELACQFMPTDVTVSKMCETRSNISLPHEHYNANVAQLFKQLAWQQLNFLWASSSRSCLWSVMRWKNRSFFLKNDTTKCNRSEVKANFVMVNYRYGELIVFRLFSPEHPSKLSQNHNRTSQVSSFDFRIFTVPWNSSWWVFTVLMESEVPELPI